MIKYSSSNRDLIPITVIAKDYGKSAKAFNQLLSELKIQYKCGNTWALYQEYADKGYTNSLTIQVSEKRYVTRTYWTEKGREFLYDFLKNKHSMLPNIKN